MQSSQLAWLGLIVRGVTVENSGANGSSRKALRCMRLRGGPVGSLGKCHRRLCARLQLILPRLAWGYRLGRASRIATDAFGAVGGQCGTWGSWCQPIIEVVKCYGAVDSKLGLPSNGTNHAIGKAL